jgi:uncharacterized membrane protein
MRSVTIPRTARALTAAATFVLASVLIHLAVSGGSHVLDWLALVAIAAVPFCIALLELRWRAWLAFCALAAAAWWLADTGGGRLLLYAPSVLVSAALAWFFGRTLRAGRQPLIVTIALAARPATPDYLLRYSRHLTVFWTGLFIAITTWNLALALFAPQAWWSAMANCGNYLVIGVAVVGEYLFRRLRFRDYAHPGFSEYLKIVVNADPRRAAVPGTEIPGEAKR